jgi:predicted transposase YbfD/YdcC
VANDVLTNDDSLVATLHELEERHQWPGLTAIGKITRVRETGDKTSTETAYYLFSAQITAERGGSVVRDHWGVENRLHWCLDVTMNEDSARNRMDNGQQNLAVLRHMALNVMRKEETKMSLRGKLKKAAQNNSYLVKLLALFEMQLPWAIRLLRRLCASLSFWA